MLYLFSDEVRQGSPSVSPVPLQEAKVGSQTRRSAKRVASLGISYSQGDSDHESDSDDPDDPQFVPEGFFIRRE